MEKEQDTNNINNSPEKQSNTGTSRFVLLGLLLFLAVSIVLVTQESLLEDLGFGGIPEELSKPSTNKTASSDSIEIKDFVLESFSSTQEAIDYLAVASEANQGFFFEPAVARTAVLESAPSFDQASDASFSEGSATGSGGGRYSDTNVQVIGIDEPDIVKTNGSEIFLSNIYSRFSPRFFNEPVFSEPEIIEDIVEIAPSARSSFYPGYQPAPPTTNILAAFPPANLSTIDELSEGGELLLEDDSLVIIGDTKISTYNISNPEEADLSWEYKLDEQQRVYTARLVDSTVFVVLESWPNYSQPCPMPLLNSVDSSISLPCDGLYHSKIANSSDITYTVVSIDINSGQVQNQVGLLADSANAVVYLSSDSVFLSTTVRKNYNDIYPVVIKRAAEKFLTNEEQKRLDEILSYDLSTQARYLEVQNLVDKALRRKGEDEELEHYTILENEMQQYVKDNIETIERTTISSFDLDTLQLSATGSVPGSPLNQFSFDQYDDVLRVATTIDPRFIGGSGIESYSEVHTLSDDLGLLGTVSNLGETERIFAVRFIQDKGYVVTFRQIDPLYVLDLSDPKNPQTTGELKIPGFSTYLHQLREGLLVGIGREGSKVKVSLFDVSDPTNPIESDNYLLSESYSDISQTHHAFLQDKEKGIFVVPATRGSYVFGYDNNTLSLEKTIAMNNPERSLYIDDYLYIIGQNEIRVFDQDNWVEVNKLDL